MADSPQQQTVDDSQNYVTDPIGSSADPAPEPFFLSKRNDCSVYLFHLSDGDWRLDVDGIVIPYDPYGTPLFSSRLIENSLGDQGQKYVSSRMGRETKNQWQGEGQAFAPLAMSLNDGGSNVPESENLDNRPLVVPLDPSSEFALRTIIATSPFTQPPNEPGSLLPSIDAVMTATTAVIQLAARRNIQWLLIPVLVDDPSYAEGTAVAENMFRAINQALSNLDNPSLKSVVISIDREEIVQHLQNLVAHRTSPTPKNDMADGRDLLNIETEAHALTEMLMLRDVEPPLCVGVLGGWGSGKSFFMHLMREKMNEIRGKPLDEEQTWPDKEGKDKDKLSEFVGHIYQIDFNAWTYAKSDLWASLMQTVFSELNRQLTLEKRLENLKGDGFGPLEGGKYWRALNYMPPDAQAALLATELKEDVFNSLRNLDANTITADSLWSALEQVRRRERNALRQTEAEINKISQELAERKANIEKSVDAEIKIKTEAAIWTPLVKKLSALWDITLAETAAFIDESEKEFEKTQPDHLKEEGLANVLTPNEIQNAKHTSFVLNNLDLDSIKTLRWLWKHKKERKLLVSFLLFVIISIVIAFVLPLIFEPMRDYLIANIVLPLLPTVGVGANLLRKTQSWRERLNDLRKSFEAEIKTEQETLKSSRKAMIEARLNEDIESLENELNKKPKDKEIPILSADEIILKFATEGENIAAMERRKAQLESRAARQRERIGLTASYISVADFVSNRLSENTYQPRLGLMQQVKSDLDELTDGLTIHDQDVYREEKQALFKRGPARIVLFIDDLDRCPPNRVVEVFEAAQLLLKTKLFVVVLALDVRYVSRALEKVYKGILSRRGDPSGLDYIEKIIQIPYRIRSIDQDALPGFLDKQMDFVVLEETAVSTHDGQTSNGSGQKSTTHPSDDTASSGLEIETAVTEAITFNTVESDIVRVCCQEIELTPRSIKRFINVFKLIKLIWQRSFRGNQEPQIAGAVALLLTLSARYPELMRRVFEHLWQQFRRNPQQNLLELLRNFPLPENEPYLENFYENWLDNLKAFAEIPELAIQLPDRTLKIGSISLHELSPETFNLIRSFCFVGDSGFDAEDKMNEKPS